MTFRHSKKWYFWASWIAWALGAVACVVPPLIATIANFPVMVTKNADSTISIFFVIGIMITLSVIMQAVVKAFKNNALLSVAVALAAVCAVFICGYYMEKETILGIAWIAGSASIGVLCGMLLFKLHKVWHDLYENCGEVYVNNG
jgi:peptidoglycan/LPS O-acetylase OafA/YrhL